MLVAFLAIAGNAVWGQETSSWTGEGSGTKDDPYQISTADELKAFRDLVNGGDADACAILTDNIELDSSEEWTPIGYANDKDMEYSYTGTFDGNGHTISNLCIGEDSQSIGSGLFRTVGTYKIVLDGSTPQQTEGTVKNLTVIGSVSTSIEYTGSVGGICAYNVGIIQNCTSNISFEEPVWGSAGGICATNSGSIMNCVNKGDIMSNGCTGGICGINGNGKIEICYNSGTISAIKGDGGGVAVAGGISGHLGVEGVIRNCYNEGTVKGNDMASGICCIMPSAPIEEIDVDIMNCHNYGAIQSDKSKIGGIFGINDDDETDVNVEVKNCYYINTIESTEEEEDEEGVEPKSADAFANGEVLYLLQQNNPGVWKQGEKGYPVFIGDEEEETILYKVAFDYNYEGSPDAIVDYVVADETVTFPTVEREGYTFMNWSTDATGETPVEDITSETVTFPTVEREGYTFMNWSTDATGETPVEDITSITLTSDMTYYAQWQSSETEEPGDDDEDQGNTGIHKPQRPIKYYNIYVDTICPGLNVEVSKDVVQEGHQVSAYLTIQAECDTTGMRFEYKRGLFGYWKDLKELEGVQPGEYIIKNIYTDIYIRALDATFPEEEPTGIEDLESVKAYAKDGSIYVYTPSREQVTIISMSGAIIKHAEQVGLQSYSVNRGIYIVRIGEKVFKLKN